MENNDHNHTDCIAMFEKLSEYIDKELDELTCKDIERHAEECIPCKACLETLKRTVDLCKHVKEDPAPESLSLKLKDMVKQLV
jgi:anti-sigma factor RsiW